MKALIAASLALALAGNAHADGETCPASFLGAVVRAEAIPGGVTLEFRNGNSETLGLMRDQLRDIAQTIERHGTERQTASDTDRVDFPPVVFDIKDIVSGARVTVRMTRLGDLTAIRELAYGFVEYWKKSPCNTSDISDARDSEHMGLGTVDHYARARNPRRSR